MPGVVSETLGRLARPNRGRTLVYGFQGPYLVGLLALVGAYYGAAHLGYAFRFAGPVAAIVWLPAGVGMAFLYLAGLRFWPAIVIGDLLVNNYSTLPAGAAVAQTAGNLIEVVLAVAVLRRLSVRTTPLSSVPGVVMVVVAVAAGAVVSATIGVLSLSLGGVVEHSLPSVWRTWLLGDFTGALIVVPLAIAWSGRAPFEWPRRRVREGAVLLVCVTAVSLAVMNTGEPLSYLVFPLLAWAALRFGQRGATIAVLIVSSFTLWGATHFHGPFWFHSITHIVLNTQLFVAVAALLTLTLAAVVSERTALMTQLRASRARLIASSQTERRRLERDLHDGAQQRLVALAAHLEISAMEAREDPARAGPMFESAQAELVLAIDQLRTLAHGIHPWMLSRLGLVGALRDLAAVSATPIYLVDVPDGRLDEGAESTAYFVVAEAVANAQKHSGASRIEVRFDAAPGFLNIEVIDDGVGGATEGAGLGLQGLRDRVEGTGGTIEIVSHAGHGTRVRAEIPAGARASAD